MGHEAIGVVEETGGEVGAVKRGDLVVMPFAFSEGTCEFCHEGLQTECVHKGFFGNGMEGIGGAQAEALRIPEWGARRPGSSGRRDGPSRSSSPARRARCR